MTANLSAPAPPTHHRSSAWPRSAVVLRRRKRDMASVFRKRGSKKYYFSFVDQYGKRRTRAGFTSKRVTTDHASAVETEAKRRREGEGHTGMRTRRRQRLSGSGTRTRPDHQTDEPASKERFHRNLIHATAHRSCVGATDSTSGFFICSRFGSSYLHKQGDPVVSLYSADDSAGGRSDDQVCVRRQCLPGSG